MKKLLLILLSVLSLVQGQSINECKVDLYYATDIILPEEEDNAEELWKQQSIELLKKYPQLNSRIGERKVAYNLSEGLISDYLVKAKENPVAGVAWTAFRIGILAYAKGKATKFIVAQMDAAMLMIHNNTLEKQIDSYNKSIESGHGVVVVAHSTGNLFTEEIFRQFDEKGEGWKQKYFHTIALASTEGNIINGGHGVTFDNDIIYLEELFQANEDVKIFNPNRHDWGYKNSLNEYILHEDFWSFEYHKFEYYLGYPVIETTRITQNFNTVESKIRQTNIAKDLIIQWLYDEIVAHESRESQWITEQESNKDTKDYRISVKHKFDPDNIQRIEDVYPFNKSKKLYQLKTGEYVKASCGGKRISETDEYWMIDNPEEEKIRGEANKNYRELFVKYYSERFIDTTIPITWDFTYFYTFNNQKYTLDTIDGHASGDRECSGHVYDNSYIHLGQRLIGSTLFRPMFDEEENMKNAIVTSINEYPRIGENFYLFNSTIKCILEKDKKVLGDISSIEHQGYTDLKKNSNNTTYILKKYSLFRIYYK